MVTLPCPDFRVAVATIFPVDSSAIMQVTGALPPLTIARMLTVAFAAARSGTASTSTRSTYRGGVISKRTGR